MAGVTWPRRGELFWVALDPVVGSEIAKTRPAVVVSNDIGNQYADRVIVAPVSSGNTQRVYPFEVLVSAGEGGLTVASKVLLDQIRTVDKRRLGRQVGELPPERMHQVNEAIRLSLSA